MKKILLSLSVISSALFVVSCVDNNYDLKKLNTEITVVQNVTLPVGETEKITFKDIIEKNTDVSTYFKQLEDGTYKAYYSGEQDFSDELPDFSEIAKIDATTFTADFEYAFEGLDPDALKIPAFSKTVEFDIIKETSTPLNALSFTMKDVDANLDFSQLAMIPGTITIPESTPYSDKVIEDLACSMKSGGISKPSIISSIDTVFFAQSKGIAISITASDIPDGLNMSLKNFSIKFPSCVKAKDADTDGVVTFTNKTFPLSETVLLEYMKPGNENGVISLDDSLIVNAEVNIWGSTPSSALSKPAKLKVSVGAQLEVSDISAMTETGNYNINVDPAKFSFDLPEESMDLGTILLNPKNSPEITIGLIVPKTDIDVKPGDDGIKITVPQMLEISDIPDGCTYDKSTRVITIANSIPDKLKFKLDMLRVTPHKVEGTCLDEGEFKIEGGVKFDKSRIHKKDIDAYLTTKFATYMEMDEINVASISFDELSVKLDKTFSIPLVKAGTLGKEIVSIGEIQFDDTWFNLGAEFKNMPSVDEKTPVKVDISLDLPEYVTPSKVSINGEIKDGKLTVDPVSIEKIDLSGLDLSKDITLDAEAHIELLATKPTVNETTLSESIGATINGGLPVIKIKKIEANVDYALAQLSKSVSFKDIFGSIGDNLDFNLALDNPYLILDLSSNISVPVDIKAELIPYKGGSPLVGNIVSINTRYEKAPSVDELSNMKVFIARKDEGRSADYKFVQADIQSVLNCKPDSIAVSLSANTDKSETSTLILDADYTLKASYEIGAPLKLDEDFLVSYKDTLLVDGFGDLLEHAAISLFGTVENKLPLQFEMEVTFLDENGKVVELSKPTKTIIASCNSDGSVAKSDFEFDLTAIDKHKAANIKHAVFAFNLTCGSASGVGIKSDSYIQASLKIKLPDGFTYDLKDLKNKQ